ncbi:MAG: P-loop NTPase fold protein [Candidatus Moraniibacteriota bacterium]
MSINKHIEEYLDYYCDFAKDLPFAVLLKGKWGCGKTYFIKNYIDLRKDKKILHVSLYGVDSFNGVKEKIIIELLPFIPEKYSNFASILYKNIKKIPKIRDWVPSDADELLVDIFLKKSNGCVFVFDDLERCNIEIDKLLGYINNFVEFKNQKVILIANEENILDSKSGDKYRKIKEKLIGKEFYINPSREEAIILFIEEITDEGLGKYLENIKKILSEIFIQSKCDNLRLIQQALFNFEYYFKSFSSKAKEDVELFERMFYEFIVIFIEHKKGEIKSDEFFKEYPQFFKGLHADKEVIHCLDKYKYGLSSWLTCFDVSVLGKILQGIDLSESEKAEMISRFENFSDVNKESWQKTWYLYEQSDEIFFENLLDVQGKWAKKEYLDLSVVLHVFGMFLDFSKNELFQKTKEEILKEGREYIEFLIEKEKIPLNIREQNAGFSWRESAYGLQYTGMQNEEWKELIKFVDEKLENLKGTYIKQKIKDELMPILRGEKSSEQSLDLLMNYNFFHHNGNRESYFQYFDVNEIVSILIEGDRMFLAALKKTFKERFEKMSTQISGIEQELPFLEKLNKELENEIKKIEEKFGNKKTPRSLLIKSFINEAIKPFIKK